MRTEYLFNFTRFWDEKLLSLPLMMLLLLLLVVGCCFLLLLLLLLVAGCCDRYGCCHCQLVRKMSTFGTPEADNIPNQVWHLSSAQAPSNETLAPQHGPLHRVLSRQRWRCHCETQTPPFRKPDWRGIQPKAVRACCPPQHFALLGPVQSPTKPGT